MIVITFVLYRNLLSEKIKWAFILNSQKSVWEKWGWDKDLGYFACQLEWNGDMDYLFGCGAIIHIFEIQVYEVGIFYKVVSSKIHAGFVGSSSNH